MFFIFLSIFQVVFSAEIEQVQVFSGKGHCRIVLSASGKISTPRTEIQRSSYSSPPRSIIRFQGLSITPPRLMEINKEGVRHIDIRNTIDALQVAVVTNKSRAIKFHRLSDSSVIVDLLKDPAREDENLPSITQLKDWFSGIRLSESKLKTKANTVIVIDPGHGGTEHGAVGVNGTREADIALQLSLRIQKYLSENKDIEVILTRTKDVSVSLHERAKIANGANADLFVSIHANAAHVDWMHGIETYSLDTASDEGAIKVARRENTLSVKTDGSKDKLLGQLVSAGTNILSHDLASEVQKVVVSEMRQVYGNDKIKDLGHKTALFYVLVSTKMPAILFEASFLSNPDDERRLRTPHFQDIMAKAIVKALIQYLEKQR